MTAGLGDFREKFLERLMLAKSPVERGFCTQSFDTIETISFKMIIAIAGMMGE